VRILFVAHRFAHFRNFESVIRLLAARGHAVHLAVERDDAPDAVAMVTSLAAEYPAVTFGRAPRREADEWARLAARIRLGSDYVRYLEPQYSGTPRLRSRAAERAPTFAVRFGESGWSRQRLARAALRRVLRDAERALPPSTQIERFLSEQQPDVMLITPLIGVVGSPQPDYVRAARSLGIPAALCVWSWDHLSSKALIRDLPDRVIVWNDVQREEARRFHGVPPDRVVVTGAQCFDQWFGRDPSRTREEFCAAAGLPAGRPVILYVGSALFHGSPPEVDFVLRWIAAVRASADPHLRTAGVLVRPHPRRMDEFNGVDLSRFGDVALLGGNPVTERARVDYFDSLFHSAAVVGLNTSAFLEAGIVGRPVLAILPPEYEDNQEGTLHFRYLTDVAGGLVRVSRTLDHHIAQLGEAVVEPAREQRHRDFLEAFLRPRGLHVPATPIFAEAVESLGTVKVPARRPAPGPIGRAALAAIAAASRSRRYGEWLWDEEDRRTAEWRRVKSEVRAKSRSEGLTPEQRAEVEEQMRAHHRAMTRTWGPASAGPDE
jgi:hypothetical protein